MYTMIVQIITRLFIVNRSLSERERGQSGHLYKQTTLTTIKSWWLLLTVIFTSNCVHVCSNGEKRQDDISS